MATFPARQAVLRFALFALTIVAGACTDKPPASARRVPVGPAPDSFRVAFETSHGGFVVQVTRAWSPRGADRFYDLVAEGFLDETRFFRVVPGFIAQFGVNDDRKRNEAWEAKTIGDDPVRQGNAHGTVVFASDGPNSRSHQLFINLADNANLDTQGFSPIGRIVSGLGVADSIYAGYGETPSYHLLATLGNSYLKRMFPRLDFIRPARLLP